MKLLRGMAEVQSIEELSGPDGFWYIGTVYSKYQRGLNAAYQYARDVSEALHDAGIPHFAPVVSSHEAAIETGIDPTDHDFWMAVDRPFMERAYGLVVVGMDGWEHSAGLTKERAYFTAAQKPIYFLDPLIILAAE